MNNQVKKPTTATAAMMSRRFRLASNHGQNLNMISAGASCVCINERKVFPRRERKASPNLSTFGKAPRGQHSPNQPERPREILRLFPNPLRDQLRREPSAALDLLRM